MSGTTFTDFINPVIYGLKHIYYPSLAETAAALSRGEVDAIALDMPVAKYLAAQNAEFAAFPEAVAPDSYGFATAKGSNLASKANETLQKLKTVSVTGEVEKIWFSNDESAKTLPELDYKKISTGVLAQYDFAAITPLFP